MTTLRTLDLFSGIGGFSLAARMVGGIETQQFAISLQLSGSNGFSRFCDKINIVPSDACNILGAVNQSWWSTMNTLPKIPAHAGIYLITCVPTGKIYVGSAANLKRRHYLHRWRLATNTHENKKLQRAWNKYGDSSFKFEVLEVVQNLQSLLAVEQKWIDSLDAIKTGFNICPTAGNSLGRSFSDETKQKIGNANRGRTPSEETRRKISLANKGKTLTQTQRSKLSASKKGKKRSQETCLQMSIRRKGLVQTHKLKSVVRMDTNEAYPSMKDAALAVGVSPSSIRQSVVSGCQCKGTHWKLKDAPLSVSKQRQKKPVKRLDTGVVFSSVKEAGKACYVSPEAISSAIKRGGKSCNTFWEYIYE